jgi:hypothetical protein
VTAKGTPCSKCAAENSPFCSIHDPSKAAGKAKRASASASASAGKKPAAKGKGLSKKAAEKESTAPASVKHSHDLDDLDYENCDLCKSHGGPFELPEYEAAATPVKKSWADEVDYDPEEDDPDYVVGGSLSEEDFDEDD